MVDDIFPFLKLNWEESGIVSAVVVNVLEDLDLLNRIVVCNCSSLFRRSTALVKNINPKDFSSWPNSATVFFSYAKNGSWISEQALVKFMLEIEFKRTAIS